MQVLALVESTMRDGRSWRGCGVRPDPFGRERKKAESKGETGHHGPPLAGFITHHEEKDVPDTKKKRK
jgi:hypothetical protein